MHDSTYRVNNVLSSATFQVEAMPPNSRLESVFGASVCKVEPTNVRRHRLGHSSPAEGRANDLVRPRPISVAGELGLILKRMREHLHELLKRL